jgi:hypothetical protein
MKRSVLDTLHSNLTPVQLKESLCDNQSLFKKKKGKPNPDLPFSV